MCICSYSLLIGTNYASDLAPKPAMHASYSVHASQLYCLVLPWYYPPDFGPALNPTVARSAPTDLQLSKIAQSQASSCSCSTTPAWKQTCAVAFKQFGPIWESRRVSCAAGKKTPAARTPYRPVKTKPLCCCVHIRNASAFTRSTGCSTQMGTSSSQCGFGTRKLVSHIWFCAGRIGAIKALGC